MQWLQNESIRRNIKPKSNGKRPLDAAEKQQRIDRLKPYRFKKGKSGNPNGRPKSFDQFRSLAQQIAQEMFTRDGDEMTVAEDVLRDWASSPEPTLQKAFVEYAFGKVPEKLHMSGDEGEPLKPMVIQVITPTVPTDRCN